LKKICILGSTGSIGKQTLEVVDNLPDVQVIGITANVNIDLLEQQIRKYGTKKVAVMDNKAAEKLKGNCKDLDIEVYQGIEGLIKIATLECADLVVTSVVGMVGLRPTVEAIKSGKDIALANKETLVTAGDIIMKLAKENDVNIFPVDSEHSAIFQCLQGNDLNEVNKIILTASGGPFRGKNEEYLKTVTLKDALNHPNWSMGQKITIDSATMMNKGLEVIEAKWLFGLEIDQIQVVIHPQSIIHSMVEYKDGSVIAQLGEPDMRVPIQYALTYPSRVENNFPKLDFLKLNQLTFEDPDYQTFKCLQLAYDSMSIGGTMTTVLNAANEKLVELYLKGKISFTDIPDIIDETLKNHRVRFSPSIDEILDVEKWTHKYIESRCLKLQE